LRVRDWRRRGNELERRIVDLKVKPVLHVRETFFNMFVDNFGFKVDGDVVCSSDNFVFDP
jgi:hypothetical protein